MPPTILSPLSTLTPDAAQRLASVRCLVLDVDGVLTDSTMTYTASGDETKTFHVKDGQGLAYLAQQGFPVALITARTSPMVARRAQELGIAHVYQGAKNKRQALDQLHQSLNLTLDQIACIGDDWPDLAILQVVGFAACPADASADVRRLCHYIATRPGGSGCVREVIDLLIQSQHRRPHASQAQ